MKQPFYALFVSPNIKERVDILRGKRKITIREGHRDYRLDLVMICCHLEPWAVMADITDVRHCILGEVTEEEYKADGFNTRDELLNELRRYYPDIDLNSPVTVIRWDNVRGWLVDHKMDWRWKTGIRIDLSNVEEIKEVIIDDDVNTFLEKGWEFLDFKVTKDHIIYLIARFKKEEANP